MKWWRTHLSENKKAQSVKLPDVGLKWEMCAIFPNLDSTQTHMGGYFHPRKSHLREKLEKYTEEIELLVKPEELRKVCRVGDRQFEVWVKW